ncbi:MAG: hypothetical protein AAF198_11305 [Pseudomonadota bacterium]
MTEQKTIRRLRLRPSPSGIFSNVNEVVEQARIAENGGYSFFIDWSVSCYRDPNRSEDPWAYYYEPCFPEVEPFADAENLPKGTVVACTRDNIITPRLQDGVCKPLLLPRDRFAAARLVHKYIRPKPYILDLVEGFCRENWQETMIGLHIRGPGRLDGGAAKLRQAFGAKGEVPFQPYFDQTDRLLKIAPDAGIFVCSDSQPVIDRVRDRYGSKVVDYPAIRSEFGEMHANHPENKGERFPPYKLGLDVIVEAMLLANTQLFVHGNSNVANFVLSYDPHILHVYVQA